MTDMTTIRNVRMDTASLVATSSDIEGVPWINLWDGGRYGFHAYFGHDAKRGLQFSSFASGLDTGCAYGRQLSAMILPEKKLNQVTAFRTYETIKEA